MKEIKVDKQKIKDMTKKILSGKVVKDKNNKTIVVLVKRKYIASISIMALLICLALLD